MTEKAGNRRRLLIAAAIVLASLLAAAAVFGLRHKERMAQLESMSFRDMLRYTAEGRDDIRITVGTIRDGKAEYTVYGRAGEVLPDTVYEYEIGSLTKTVTGALICRAVSEGRMELDAPVSRYIPLPEGTRDPTIVQLVTHTSGYPEYYFEWEMAGNFLSGRNAFCSISREKILSRAAGVRMEDRNYGFCYSNFGMALAGAALEEVYDKDYTSLAEEFLQDTLGLEHTRISTMDSELGKNWAWGEDDGYLLAGALVSNIEDMLQWASLQMEEDPEYLAPGHQPLRELHITQNGVRMDAVGVNWIYDGALGIWWHNGGTGDYNSYLCFDPEEGTAVVILSNTAPGYRIPATMMGIRLYQEGAE